MLDELESKTINWVKVPLTLGVIFIHIYAGGEYNNLFGNQILNTFYYYYTIIASVVLPSIVVPCFFLISGYLFFNGVTRFDFFCYKAKLHKRVRSLLIPYVLWNCLSVIAHYFYSFVIDKPEWRDEIGGVSVLKFFWSSISWNADAKNLLGWSIPGTGPINYALWYIRDLMVLAVLSYFIFYAIKRFKYGSLLFLFVVYFTQVWIPLPGFSALSLFYFSIGAWLSIYGKSFIVRDRRRSVMLACLACFFLIMTLVSLPFDDNLFLLCYMVVGVFSFFSLAGYCVNKNILSIHYRLAQPSFFVFLCHAIFLIGFCGTLLNFFIPFSFCGEMLNYTILPFVIFAVSFLIYKVLKLLSPKILKVLMGGRV